MLTGGAAAARRQRSAPDTWRHTHVPRREEPPHEFGLTAEIVDLPSLRIGNTKYNFHLVFGRFPAELGPETRSIGRARKMVQNAPKISPGDQF